MLVDRKTGISILILAASAITLHSQSQSLSHEEEVVRSTYAALSFLCGLEPVTSAAVRQMRQEINETSTDREVVQATPTFEISKVKTGTIASISSQIWGSRYSVPDKDNPVVLIGTSVSDSYTDEQTNSHWKEARVHWDVDHSYTESRLAGMQKLTVGQAVELGRTEWTVPATYTRYATFEVTLTFQDRTVGPYTASFFFGRDAQGREVVVPQDAIGAGQLLWEALRQTAYPTEIVKNPRLRQQPVMDRWIRANKPAACRSPHDPPEEDLRAWEREEE